MSMPRAAGDGVEGYELDGFALPADLQLPTTDEIERDLALDRPAWRNLLRSSESEPKQSRPHPRGAPVGFFSRVLVLMAVAAVGAAVGGAVKIAIDSTHKAVASRTVEGAGSVQATDSCFTWTVRGPVPFCSGIRHLLPPSCAGTVSAR